MNESNIEILLDYQYIAFTELVVPTCSRTSCVYNLAVKYQRAHVQVTLNFFTWKQPCFVKTSVKLQYAMISKNWWRVEFLPLESGILHHISILACVCGGGVDSIWLSARRDWSLTEVFTNLEDSSFASCRKEAAGTCEYQSCLCLHRQVEACSSIWTMSESCGPLKTNRFIVR